MRILVFGGDGMLGHQLVEAWQAEHEVWATLRIDRPTHTGHPQASLERILFGVDVRRPDDVDAAIVSARPEAVVNAVGIVKQRSVAREAIPSLEVNSLFPHRLSLACQAAGARLVHLSTDCVFSGRKGHYVETDETDPVDLYGRSKLLGEVQDPHCLTLRTSIIGLELGRKSSLVEWFLAQHGRIQGYRRAIYSGLTTREMARAISHFLVHDPGLSGLWHLSSAPVAKFDLLSALARRLGRTGVEVVPNDALVCDRSLDSSALRQKTKYRVPSWDAMLDELADDILRRERNA